MPDSGREAKIEALREAGRKGGNKVLALYGLEHFSRIGTKGAMTPKSYGSRSHHRRIGRKGGAALKAKVGEGSGYFATIGRRGGEATLAKHGPEHYAAIARLSHAARKRRKEARR